VRQNLDGAVILLDHVVQVLVPPALVPTQHLQFLDALRISQPRRPFRHHQHEACKRRRVHTYQKDDDTDMPMPEIMVLSE
jgi:hypothetical protein